jgi:signal transduction histidine kinase
MMWMNKSLFRRLLVSYLVTVLLGLGVSGVAILWFAKGYIYQTTQEDLIRKAKQVNMTIQSSPQMDQKKMEMIEFLDRTFDTRIWIFDRKGKIIATSMQGEVFVGKPIASLIVKRVLEGQDVATEIGQFAGLNEPMLSVVVPWGNKDQIYGGIVLHTPIEGIKGMLSYMRESVLGATLFGVLLSTAMVSYLSWSILRPLQKIERTTMEIGMGNYGQRVSVKSPDEIRDLAQTINTVARKLEIAEHERQRQEKIQQEFLANISHELRTPLTTMQGFLEALSDGLVDEEEAKQRYYQVMHQETTHLNRLVGDLMDLIKLEIQEITLFKTLIDPGEVIRKAAFSFHREAEDKETMLKVLIEPNLPMLWADRDRMMQILKNLLKNAVKFTDKGTIEIHARKLEKELQIQVVDTGAGIAAADMERIWERFFKVDRVRSKHSGTGLGLAIVKRLVDLHQGRIVVSSQLGQGTVFSLYFPIDDSLKRTNSIAG